MKTTTTLNNNKNLLAVTHFNQFHADDVTAGALISVFLKEDYGIIEFDRVNYQTPITEILARENDNTDVIIFDVGRCYDPSNGLFDHHQFRADEDGRASAGMVFDWLISEGKIGGRLEKLLRPLIKMVDDNDIGVRQAGEWEFPMIISKMNEEYNAPQEAHYEAFLKAVEFTAKLIEGEVAKAEKLEKATELLLNADTLDIGEEGEFRGLFINQYPEEWYDVINELEVLDDVDFIAWRDTKTGEFKAQTVAKEPGSFVKRGRKILVDDGRITNDPDLVFVHKGEFFMVAKTRDTLVKYLEDNLVY